MSFKAAKWDEDELGTKMHGTLFKKKKRIVKSKTKPKRKKKDEKDDGEPAKEITKSNIVAAKSVLSNKIANNLKKIFSNSDPGESPPQKDTPIENSTQNVKRRIRRRFKTPVNTKMIIRKVPNKAQLKMKKKLKRLDEKKVDVAKDDEPKAKPIKIAGLNIANLKKQLAASLESGNVKELSFTNTLRDRMLDKLNSARFRYLNEQMYTTEGKDAQKMFESDPEAFEAYHQGYRQQVEKWPLNPLDFIISSIKKMPPSLVVADFGCGDAKLSESVTQQVHSFDLVAANEKVVACDMAHVPLKNASVDVAVFCLSLMGTNLKDYLAEANRVLKLGGTLKIAEVESRFEAVESFVKALDKFGFKNSMQDLSHNLFYFMDFVKERDIKNKQKLPKLNLNPCLYKKR